MALPSMPQSSSEQRGPRRISRSWVSPLDQEYVENPAMYSEGGYHLVHLHDRFDNGRYRVVDKLGFGRSATVWLCQDTLYSTPKYVAVKIIIAHQTEISCRELRMVQHMQALGIDRQPAANYICLPLRDFRLEGPNGTHICIVYPVFGPTLESAREILRESLEPEDCAREVRRLMQQVATGLALLHANGICHGGVHTAQSI